LQNRYFSAEKAQKFKLGHTKESILTLLVELEPQECDRRSQSQVEELHSMAQETSEVRWGFKPIEQGLGRQQGSLGSFLKNNNNS
jgi:hypothetical protein